MWSVAIRETFETRMIQKIMILTAFALDLDEDGKVFGGLAIPRLEGLEDLKTVRLGVNGDLDASTISRRRLEGVLARVVATRGKLSTVGGGELEFLAISASQSVSEGVKSEATGESHGRDKVRRGDIGMGGRVSVVAASEVAVVRGDDCNSLGQTNVLRKHETNTH